MRTHIITIILLCMSLAAYAEESTKATMSPIDQIKVDTWQMSPAVIEHLSRNLGQKSEFDRESFATSIMAGVTNLTWNFCTQYFEQKVCNNEGYDFTREVKNYVLGATFAASADESTIKSIVGVLGIGRTTVILKQTRGVYTKPFDLANGLAYVAWGEHLCHIRLAYGDKHLQPGDWTLENCKKDTFTQHLKETYCADDASDQCLLNSGWLYGFLVRRYFDGGEEAVKNWQKLLQSAAVVVGMPVVETVQN